MIEALSAQLGVIGSASIHHLHGDLETVQRMVIVVVERLFTQYPVRRLVVS